MLAGNASPTPPITHQFLTVTYTKPTYCDYCEKLIWGIIKQGLNCNCIFIMIKIIIIWILIQACGYNVHSKCQSIITLLPCSTTVNRNQPDIGVDTNSINSLSLGDEESMDEIPDTAEIVHAIVSSAITTSESMAKVSGNPQLNVMTTMPKNVIYINTP